MNENVRTYFLIEPQRLGLFSKVIVAATRNGDFAAPGLTQLFHNKRAEKTVPSAHNYAPLTPKTHFASLMLRSLTADRLHDAGY